MLFTSDYFPQLIFIDTLISQDHLRNFRQLCFPERYRDSVTTASINYDMSFGTLDKDGPFIVDPTQAFIILQLPGAEEQTRVCVVLRTQALIEHACSMRTENYIPWEEWARNSIIMERQTSNLPTYIQGVHLIETEMRRVPGGNVDMSRIYLRTFDLSKRGVQHAL